MDARTVVSLFSGIGGIDLAFAAAGFTITAQVEIDAYCRKVLAYHAREYWPDATQFTDVRTVGRKELGGEPTVLAAGFPCQPHSIAGSRKGETDSRNLWPETRRIIGDIRPRVVFLENVPGILTTIAANVLADLTRLGYVGSTGIISARDAGGAHTRARWFVVAYADGQRTRHGHNQLGHAYVGRYSQVAVESGEYEPVKIRRGGQILGDGQKPRLPQGQRPPIRTDTAQTRQRLGHHRPQRSGFDGYAAVNLAQPGLGDTTDGIPRWLAQYRQPALQGEAQYAWEYPRGIPTAAKGKEHKLQIQALGNAVFPLTVYPIAKAIMAVMDGR